MADMKAQYSAADAEKRGLTGLRDAAADVALGIFEEVREGAVTDGVDDRKLLSKIDLRLMPLM